MGERLFNEVIDIFAGFQFLQHKSVHIHHIL